MKVNKLFSRLVFVLLLCCYTECRHHGKSNVQVRAGDESFEDYLNHALQKFKSDDVPTPAVDNKLDVSKPDVGLPLRNKPSIVQESPNARSTIEHSRDVEKSGNSWNKINDFHVRNAEHGPVAKRRTKAPWTKKLKMAHRPNSPHKTTKTPTIMSGMLMDSLKPLIQREVMKDFALIRQIEDRLTKYNGGQGHENDGQGHEIDGAEEGVKKNEPEKTFYVAGESSFSMADGKNWLLFGIGVGSTILLFLLCILGFHCFRCIRYKDGLFVKNVGLPVMDAGSSTTCKNNNNHSGDRRFLTRGQRVDEFSSEEEEVFNVSIPRYYSSIHTSLPSSPVVQQSSTSHSTPIKTRKPLLQ